MSKADGRTFPRDNTAYAIEMHIKRSTDIITVELEKETKAINHGLDKISDDQTTIKNEVISAKEAVVATIKNEVKLQAEEYSNDVNRFIESHNAIIDSVNDLSETQNGLQTAVLEQNKKISERADRSERTSYQVRGQLGAQERKRRKVDLDEIGRLRNEIGVLKRQHNDKDNMVKALSAHVASLVGQMEEIRHDKEELRKDTSEIRQQNNTLIDLVRTLVARGN